MVVAFLYYCLFVANSLELAVALESSGVSNSSAKWGKRHVEWDDQKSKLRDSFFGGGSCISSRGVFGKCYTMKECYPFYKMHQWLSYEYWLLSMRDSCIMIDSNGQQETGVCCNLNPILYQYPAFYPYPDILYQQPGIQYPSWPPQIPTHPPNHTPATHPPYPSYPQQTRPTPRPPTSHVTVKPTYPSNVVPEDDDPGRGHDCGIKNGYQDQERIVGGRPAEPEEWPWMAAILNNGRLFCGGSLIDDIHILSAAHCVAHMGPWDVARLRVHLGDHNIKNRGEVAHIERRVKKVVRHRGFDPQKLYNDIALLTLDSPVKFSKKIRPVCLPQGKGVYQGKVATVTGWGSLRERGPTPSVLQEVNIPIWTNSECKSKYGQAAPGGIIETFLCAGIAGRDSCSGDSGGPLMINEGRWMQIGIVSWGIGCGKGQFPGVYTRVTSFMPWITKNLNT